MNRINYSGWDILSLRLTEYRNGSAVGLGGCCSLLRHVQTSARIRSSQGKT
jgi:hypothetical protein